MRERERERARGRGWWGQACGLSVRRDLRSPY